MERTDVSDSVKHSLANNDRIDWVDGAKGICITLVVVMHSTLGVEAAMGTNGWMNEVVAFARPFRMPAFFLICGLFLALTINRPWRGYLDRKVVHFLYFYILWLSIQFAFKAPAMAMERGAAEPLLQYLLAFIQPYGTLWFIYILPIFFLFTRLVKGLPQWFVLGWAAILSIMPIHSGWVLFDEFCARYIYFFAGYALAANIFAMAEWMRANIAKTVTYLVLWAIVNTALVFIPAPAGLGTIAGGPDPALGDEGLAGLPVVSLMLGTAGTIAIIAISALLARYRTMGWLSWLGAHSIVVYLAFFLPMAVTRIALIRLGIVTDAGTISAIVTVAAIAGPVVLYGFIQKTGYGRFLFERPLWARIERPNARSNEAIATS